MAREQERHARGEHLRIAEGIRVLADEQADQVVGRAAPAVADERQQRSPERTHARLGPLGAVTFGRHAGADERDDVSGPAQELGTVGHRHPQELRDDERGQRIRDGP